MENMVGQAQNIQVPNYSGVNIQIFNPSVAAPGGVVPASNVNAPSYSTSPVYPPNYYINNLPQSPQIPAAVPEKKKTEKRDIVVLTDDYIKTVEQHLSHQDSGARLKGAKEVLARFQEDDTRKDDPALNAFVNKMLQDPYQPVRLMAFSALDSRAASGDNLTKKILTDMSHQEIGTGKGRMESRLEEKRDDSLMAANILLKMSGQTTQKEFEVKEPKVVYVDKSKKKEKKEEKK